MGASEEITDEGAMEVAAEVVGEVEQAEREAATAAMQKKRVQSADAVGMD